MTNQVCHFLSNKYKISSDFGRLSYKPCCYFSQQVYFDDPEFELKKDQIQNLSQCFDCAHYTDLDDDNLSIIERSRRQIPKETPTGVPKILELTIDTNCNAACLSCNDSLSSTWRAQNIKFKIKTLHNYPDALDPVDVTDQLFSHIDFSELTRIEFLGGEPFRSVTTELVLEHAAQHSNCENLDLMFSTNGTVRPSDNILKLLPKFKSVLFLLSIDGVNDKFSYLRYPLQWDSLIKNLNFLMGESDQFNYKICYTLGVLNVLSYQEVVEWANEFFSNYPRYAGTSINLCVGNIGLEKITPELKALAIEQHKSRPDMHNILTKVNASPDYTSLLNFINTWDSNRDTNWKQVFPELISFLK